MEQETIEAMIDQLAASTQISNGYVKRIRELEQELKSTKKRYGELLTEVKCLKERCREYADEVAIKTNTVHKLSIKVAELEEGENE